MNRINHMICVVKKTLADKENAVEFKKKGVINTAYPMEQENESLLVTVSIEKIKRMPDDYSDLMVRDLEDIARYWHIERDEETGITTLYFEVQE